MAPNITTITNRINLEKSSLIFFVNGKKIIDDNPDPEYTLLAYLREKLHLVGTKLGCGEGGCGACTVMISKLNRQTQTINHMAVNACLTPICSVHGLAVTTVEGIGSTKTKLHPVQERIARAHGSQCGFCTPGIVMSMYALLRSTPKPSMKDLEITFQGNLCRCTGYRPIIDGYRTFTSEYECGMGENCCRKQQSNGTANGDTEVNKLFDAGKFSKYYPDQEPIFPPELKLNDELDRKSICFSSDRVIWYRPTKLHELLAIKREYPNAKIVVGNTEIGVELKSKKFYYPVLVMSNQIIELNEVKVRNNGVHFGASVTLDKINETLNTLINQLPEPDTRLFKSIIDMLHYFAGKQIRNVASIGGNIMTGSPISDLIPIFVAAEVELQVESLEKGERTIKMNDKFFIGYRKNILESDEILKSIFITKTINNQYVIAYKQAKRREDDIAIVNMALNVKFKADTDIVEQFNIAYGGMGPTVVTAPKTSKIAIGLHWHDETFIDRVNEELANELPLLPNAPGGMILYRQSLTLSLFYKAYLTIHQCLELRLNYMTSIPVEERSGANLFQTLTPKSSQVFEQDSDNLNNTKPVGQPLIFSSAYQQATGEAIYCDDQPKFENELYLAHVLSDRSYAKILSIDATEALKIPGVRGILTANDLSDEQNIFGTMFQDEQIFISDTVTSQGQVIAAIVAENQMIAQRACKLVKIEYQELSPVIITIEDAIKYESFYPENPSISKGNIEEAFAKADFVIEGDCRMGGQEHFYLETHAAIAVPRDANEFDIYCCNQHPSEIQYWIANVTGLPLSNINVRVKRIGGGFGGKESRGALTILPVALAAQKFGCPVRCMLNRDEDMMMTGTRHPFYFKYKASCTKTGHITGCQIELYNNAGYSRDLSIAVIMKALQHIDNCYFIPNVKLNSFICKTNLPSNTAFRGFGAPQAMFCTEHILRDIARVIGKDYNEVAELNLYRECELTHTDFRMTNCTIRRCWSDCLKNSDYLKRKAEVDKFNENNKWRKRGIAMVPTKFGIGLGATFYNQAGALVLIYKDGSVLLNHGGTEMGQGIHTKMIQIAATVLNISIDRIHIMETGTDKIPNTSPTAGSTGSDLNGMAVLDACNKLVERLKPYRDAYPNVGWNAWIQKAYYDRVSLSANGFYATPNLDFNPITNTGQAYTYFTFGVACSEVEIDCLTGDHQVIRTDIVMDCGTSLNPAVDIGQIEGAFMQGYGLFTLEELIYSPDGTMLSKGPGMYKLPGFTDIPAELNVVILTGAPNPTAVFSSKATGEPPLFLAASIFFAIKNAISAARVANNLDANFKLMSPATCERIRIACEDDFTKKFKEPAKGTSWNIMP